MKLLKPHKNIVIEGRRIILKPITENEINEKYVSWLNNPEINKYLEVRHKKQSISDIYNYVNSLRSNKGTEIFGIFDKNKIHIGNCAITHFNPNNNGYAIFGIMIGDNNCNYGYAVDTEILIVDYLFSFNEIRRIEAGVLSKNSGAWKVIESLGFKKEGVIRQKEVLLDNSIDDIIIYGLLKNEWIDHKKNNNLIKYFLHDLKVNITSF